MKISIKSTPIGKTQNPQGVIEWMMIAWVLEVAKYTSGDILDGEVSCKGHFTEQFSARKFAQEAPQNPYRTHQKGCGNELNQLNDTTQRLEQAIDSLACGELR